MIMDLLQILVPILVFFLGFFFSLFLNRKKLRKELVEEINSLVLEWHEQIREIDKKIKFDKNILEKEKAIYEYLSNKSILPRFLKAREKLKQFRSCRQLIDECDKILFLLTTHNEPDNVWLDVVPIPQRSFGEIKIRFEGDGVSYPEDMLDKLLQKFDTHIQRLSILSAKF